MPIHGGEYTNDLSDQVNDTWIKFSCDHGDKDTHGVGNKVISPLT